MTQKEIQPKFLIYVSLPSFEGQNLGYILNIKFPDHWKLSFFLLAHIPTSSGVTSALSFLFPGMYTHSSALKMAI